MTYSQIKLNVCAQAANHTVDRLYAARLTALEFDVWRHALNQAEIIQDHDSTGYYLEKAAKALNLKWPRQITQPGTPAAREISRIWHLAKSRLRESDYIELKADADEQ